MDPPASGNGPDFKNQVRSVAAVVEINAAAPSNDSAVAPVIVAPTRNDDSGPTYKDQASSVALSRRTDDKLALAAAAPMLSNASQHNNSEGNHLNPGVTERDAGPAYKDQARPAHPVRAAVVSPNPSAQSTKRSNVSSSLSSDIPMVQGVLVPDEQLTEEERRSNQEVPSSELYNNRNLPFEQQGVNSMQEPSNPSNQVSETQDDPKLVQLRNDDMHFWAKMILLTIFCNTLFVAAVVVGTFCGIGACGSSNADLSAPPPIPYPIGSRPPSDAPSQFPSLSPFFVSAPSPPTTVTFSPTLPLDSNTPIFSPVSLPSPSSAPSVALGSSMPTHLPTLMPSSDNASISVGALVAIAVVLDILLVSGCLYGYYKWKRRPTETSKTDAIIGDADVGDSVDPDSC